MLSGLLGTLSRRAYRGAAGLFVVHPAYAADRCARESWSVLCYGPPVGQVYLKLYKNGEFIGDFYIGPWFFGRDYGDFFSQRAAEEEIAHLGQLLSVPLVEIVNRV